jgi:hypothetical protein
MNNERKPLLSDKDIQKISEPVIGKFDDIPSIPFGGNAIGSWLVGFTFGAEKVRAYYESLIDEGKLRVVEDVAPSFIHGEIKCGKCEGRLGNTYADALPNYCHRCGNKIKRA